MDRQYPANGFTLLESLFVLLILSITVFSFSSVSHKPSVEIVCKRIMNLSITLKERAYSTKIDQYVSIGHDQAVFEDIVYTYPEGIVCEGYQYHFNAKGNINQAGTITCSDGHTLKRIVVQLGSGCMRIE